MFEYAVTSHVVIQHGVLFYYSENTELTSTSIGKTWEGPKLKLILKFCTGTAKTLAYFGFQNHIRH